MEHAALDAMASSAAARGREDAGATATASTATAGRMMLPSIAADTPPPHKSRAPPAWATAAASVPSYSGASAVASAPALISVLTPLQQQADVLRQLHSVLAEANERGPAQELLLRDQLGEAQGEVDDLTAALKRTSVVLIKAQQEAQQLRAELGVALRRNVELQQLLVACSGPGASENALARPLHWSRRSGGDAAQTSAHDAQSQQADGDGGQPRPARRLSASCANVAWLLFRWLSLVLACLAFLLGGVHVLTPRAARAEVDAAAFIPLPLLDTTWSWWHLVSFLIHGQQDEAVAGEPVVGEAQVASPRGWAQLAPLMWQLRWADAVALVWSPIIVPLIICVPGIACLFALLWRRRYVQQLEVDGSSLLFARPSVMQRLLHRHSMAWQAALVLAQTALLSLALYRYQLAAHERHTSLLVCATTPGVLALGFTASSVVGLLLTSLPKPAPPQASMFPLWRPVSAAQLRDGVLPYTTSFATGFALQLVARTNACMALVCGMATVGIMLQQATRPAAGGAPSFASALDAWPLIARGTQAAALVHAALLCMAAVRAALAQYSIRSLRLQYLLLSSGTFRARIEWLTQCLHFWRAQLLDAALALSVALTTHACVVAFLAPPALPTWTQVSADTKWAASSVLHTAASPALLSVTLAVLVLGGWWQA